MNYSREYATMEAQATEGVEMFNYEVIHEGVGVIAEGMTNRVWDEEELEDFIARLFPGTGAYTFTAFDDEVGAFAQTTITV